jgi:hypothetical protein
MQRRIQIIGAPRSGTTFLASTICSYLYSLDPYHEKLNHGYLSGIHGVPTPSEEMDKILLENIEAINNSSRVIVKNHMGHYLNLMRRGLLKHFNHNDFHNIGIIRRDIVDTSLSLTLATKTNQWTVYDYQNQQTELGRKELIRDVTHVMNSLEALLSNRFGVRYDDFLIYEDIPTTPKDLFCSLKLCQLPENEIPETELREVEKAPDKSAIISNFYEARETVLNYAMNRQSEFMKLEDGVIVYSTLLGNMI